MGVPYCTSTPRECGLTLLAGPGARPDRVASASFQGASVCRTDARKESMRFGDERPFGWRGHRCLRGCLIRVPFSRGLGPLAKRLPSHCRDVITATARTSGVKGVSIR